MSAGTAHRMALLEKWEATLTDAQRQVWGTLMLMLPKESPLVGTAGGYGLECYLMGHVKRGATVEQLKKFIPSNRHGERQQSVDRRAAAAGDKDFAA